MMKYLVPLLAQLTSLATALTAAEWRNQSIYFLMTDRFARTDGSLTAPCNVSALEYCGGSWAGVIQHLDYIQDMGFTAVWVTPVTHQIQTSPAYHGYWQDDLYDVNPQFGTMEDLNNLSTALHDRGMYLMVDVVANHFAYTGIPNGTDYEAFTPFNNEKYFHPLLKPDYGPPQNQTSVEIGWLVSDPTPVTLPDVNTTREDVRQLYYDWIRDLVANYSIDGLRVDTVKHVEKDFWPGFNEAAGVYCVGEVFETVNETYLCDYQNYMDAVLNYGPFNEIQRAFVNSTGNMIALATRVHDVQAACKDVTVLGSFMENHDNARFPNTTTDIALAANAIAFTMLSDGIPIIYYGQEQHDMGGHDPYNRVALWEYEYNTNTTLYQLITALNAVRSNAITVDSSWLESLAEVIYVDPNTLALRRGPDGAAIITVVSNLGTDNATDYTVDLNGAYTGYEAGTSLTEVLTCTNTTVTSSGGISVAMSEGAPKVFFATDSLNGICSS